MRTNYTFRGLRPKSIVTEDGRRFFCRFLTSLEKYTLYTSIKGYFSKCFRRFFLEFCFKLEQKNAIMILAFFFLLFIPLVVYVSSVQYDIL